MSDPATIAREYLEGWNRRDWARWRELLHPQYTYTGGDGQLQKGPEAALAVGLAVVLAVGYWFMALPRAGDTSGG